MSALDQNTSLENGLSMFRKHFQEKCTFRTWILGPMEPFCRNRTLRCEACWLSYLMTQVRVALEDSKKIIWLKRKAYLDSLEKSCNGHGAQIDHHAPKLGRIVHIEEKDTCNLWSRFSYLYKTGSLNYFYPKIMSAWWTPLILMVETDIENLLR